ELDPLQRAEAELLNRRSRRDIPAACVSGDECRERILTGANPGRRCAAAPDPLADRRAFQLARALRARQLRLGPHNGAADLLMFLELCVRLARDLVGLGPRIEHEHG